jgi:hypothetical protein
MADEQETPQPQQPASDSQPQEQPQPKRYRLTKFSGGGMGGGQSFQKVVESPEPAYDCVEVPAETPLTDWEPTK